MGGGDTLEYLDFPSLGVDNNALYIGGDMFTASTGAFTGSSVFVIRKTTALSGGPLVTTAFRGLVPNPATSEGMLDPRGMDNYNPTANEGYFIGTSNLLFGELVMRRISTPGGTPAISADILIPVNATAFPIPVDHLGNTGGIAGRLESIDDRLFAAHIRNGRLWTAHNIAVDATGVASNGRCTTHRGALVRVECSRRFGNADRGPVRHDFRQRGRSRECTAILDANGDGFGTGTCRPWF